VATVAMATVFVALAATGTLTRAGAQGLALRWGVWPAGTLAVNLAGSLAVGLLAGAAGDDLQSASTLAMVTVVGGLGAFTTFSALALEVGVLVERRQWFLATAYAAGTLVGGVALAWLGLVIAS
jgi:fluoride exporter